VAGVVGSAVGSTGWVAVAGLGASRVGVAAVPQPSSSTVSKRQVAITLDGLIVVLLAVAGRPATGYRRGSIIHYNGRFGQAKGKWPQTESSVTSLIPTIVSIERNQLSAMNARQPW